MGFINIKPLDQAPSLNPSSEEEVVATKAQENDTFVKMPEMPTAKRIDTRTEAQKYQDELLEGQALEGGMVMPFTPQWKLLDKIGNAATGAVGKTIGAVMDMYKTRGMPQSTIDVIKNGNKDELEALLIKLKSVKGSGGDFGDDLLGVKIHGAPDNFFEKRRFFNSRVPRIEADIRKKTKDLIPGSPELQAKLDKAVNDAYKVMDDKVSTAYGKVQDAGDDSYKYNVTAMREEILTKLRDEGLPEPVIRNIKRNLFYIERNLTPAEKGAQGMLPKLDEAFEQSSAELAIMVPKGRDGRKSLLNEANKLYDELKATPAANRTTNMTELSAAIKKYKSTKDRLVNTEGLLPNFDEVGEKEFIRLIREVNRKKFVGGGDMGKYDMEEQRGLTMAKRMIEDYFEKATAETNPTIAPLFKEARKTYAEKIRRFGPQNRGSDNFPELGRMVKDKFSEGQDIDIEKQIQNMLKSPMKIKHIGKILDEQNPGMGKEIAEEWLYKKLGTVRQGDNRLVDFNRADLPGLRNQLDDIVSDERSMKFIEETMGVDKVREVEALHSMTSSLNTLVKDITKKGGDIGDVGDQSAWEAIKETEGKLGLNKLSKTVKMIGDFYRDSGGSGGYSTEVLQRAAEYVRRIQKSNSDYDKAMAAQELKSFMEKAMTKVVGRQSSHGASAQTANDLFGVTNLPFELNKTFGGNNE